MLNSLLLSHFFYSLLRPCFALSISLSDSLRSPLSLLPPANANKEIVHLFRQNSKWNGNYPSNVEMKTLRVDLEVLQFEVIPLSGIVTKIHSFHSVIFGSMVVVVIVIFLGVTWELNWYSVWSIYSMWFSISAESSYDNAVRCGRVLVLKVCLCVCETPLMSIYLMLTRAIYMYVMLCCWYSVWHRLDFNRI